MSLPLLLGALTLAPLLCALLIAVLGVARYALKPLALALGLIGLIVPVVLLLMLLPSLSSGMPIFVGLFGGAVNLTFWFSAVYRIDGFGLYAALGIAVIVAPLLLWMAWKGIEASAEPAESAEGAETAGEPQRSWWGSRLGRAQWGGVALALAIESAALTLVFADNIAWLALSWVVLIALAWGIGELGSDLDTVDRIGLLLMALGPLLWTAVMLIPAIGQGTHPIIYPRLTDMMGRGSLTPLHVLLLAIALTLAGAGYPFIVWMRRRALLVTPAGLVALVLAVLPVALVVGARTYSAAQDANSSWQEIGKTAPPITAGIWFCLLGMLTVCVCGLLALGRRDSRTLIAYLAVAQVGWGLLALGAGDGISMLALATLLATSLFGFGAMLAALFAGGRLTSDIEPEGAGPQAFGVPVQPVYLAAWIVGALTLLGAPLFGGFVARQMISASIIHARGLAVPLVGISWAGDALLALALLRATAPAFTSLTALARGKGKDNESGMAKPAPRAPVAIGTLLPQAVAVIFGLLAILVGALPQVWLNIGALPAASALVQDGQANAALSTKTFGYLVGVGSAGQWVPSLAWVALIVLVLLALFALPGGLRETRPAFLAGASVEPATTAATPPQTAQTEEEETTPEPISPELAYLPEPVDAWSDLRDAFASAWLVPLNEQLLRGVDDEAASEEEATGAAEETSEDLEEEAAESEEADEADEVEEAEGVEVVPNAERVPNKAPTATSIATPEVKPGDAAPVQSAKNGKTDASAAQTTATAGTNATNAPQAIPPAKPASHAQPATPKATIAANKPAPTTTNKSTAPANEPTPVNTKPANTTNKPQQTSAGKSPGNQNRPANTTKPSGKPGNTNAQRPGGGAANRPQSKKSGTKKSGKGGGR